MKKLLLLSFLFIGLFSQAQLLYSSYLQKYANYRYFFRGDKALSYNSYPSGGWSGYIALGEGQGMSIPVRDKTSWLHSGFYHFMSGKIYDGYWDCSYQGISPYQVLPSGVTSNINSPADTLLYKGQIGFGDGILPDLGYYLGVLATEWKLRKKNNMPLQEIELELEYALLAIDRLDYIAEERYWQTKLHTPYTNYVGSVNGLLWRDDVPWDFAMPEITVNGNIVGHKENYFGDDYNIVGSRYSCIDWQQQPRGCGDCIENGLDIAQFKPETEENLMSQDQVLKMYVGLALVAKLVDDQAMGTVPGSVGYVFNDWASDIAVRIASYIRQGGSSFCGDHTTGLWKIEDPEGDLVCPGADLSFNCWALAKSTNKIQEWAHGSYQNMQNTYSNTVGALLWQGQSQLYDYTVGYGGYRAVISANTDEMYGLMRIISGYNATTISRKIIGRMADLENKPEWDLLRAVLHDKTPYLKKDFFKYIIGNFPCQEPPATQQWEQNNGLFGGWELSTTRTNGLQHMLLINLYALVDRFPDYTGAPVATNTNNPKLYDIATGNQVGYSDYRTRVVTNTFPDITVSPIIGVKNVSVTNLLDLRAAENLSLAGKLNADAYVEFRAPHITIEPGFETTIGAVADIVNLRMDCVSDVLINNDNSQILSSAKTEDTLLIGDGSEELTPEELAENAEFLALVDTTNRRSNQNDQQLVLIPNPSNEGTTITLFLNQQNTNVTISIIDVNGKIVYQQILNSLEMGKQEFYFKTSYMQKGIYSVVFISDQSQLNKTLIVQ